MRNGSRSEYFHVEGGFKLTRVRQSEWRRRWGIAAIQVFDAQVAASADDAWTNSGAAFNGTDDRLVIGETVGTFYDSFARWDNVTVPAGATVAACNISQFTFSSSNDGANLKTDLAFAAADDQAAPTTRAELDGIARTSVVAWDDQDFTVDTWFDSPDLTGPIQEVFDRGGWASGQAVLLAWDERGGLSDNNKFYQPSTYDRATDQGLKLHVEYAA